LASSLQVVVVVVASTTPNVAVTFGPVVDPLVGAVIVTAGLTESTVKVVVAEPEPDALVAVTSTVWLPCARPLVANDGAAQATAASASILQVVLVGELEAVNDTVGEVLLTKLPLAGALITTTGAGVGAVTVKVVEALPVLPAASVATTVIVWLATESAL
jgi:hypothetical protein